MLLPYCRETRPYCRETRPYCRETRPDVTGIETRPLALQAASSCTAVRAKNTVVLELAPWSEPAKDPVTLVVPPGLGNVNPMAPEWLDATAYSENVTVLGRIVAGVQMTLTVRELVVSTRLQAFDGLEIVVVALPSVTLETLEPEVVHPTAVNLTAVDSVLLPVVVSGGENVSPPVILVHVMPPVATVAVERLELELQPAVIAATNASERSDADFHCRPTDMARPPWLTLVGHSVRPRR